jgi:hypothetical protein
MAAHLRRSGDNFHQHHRQPEYSAKPPSSLIMLALLTGGIGLIARSLRGILRVGYYLWLAFLRRR